jgi:hypothetical protein
MKVISTLQCNALGLNSHFPCALLHGSVLLGGRLPKIDLIISYVMYDAPLQ